MDARGCHLNFSVSLLKTTRLGDLGVCFLKLGSRRSLFPYADVHDESAEGMLTVARVSTVARMGMFSLPALWCC